MYGFAAGVAWSIFWRNWHEAEVAWSIKAKALTPTASVYREVGEFDRGVQHHAALEILDRSRGKLDPAEACYQLAQT